MIRITERTGKTLEMILRLAKAREGHYVRLDIPSNCFSIDRERPGDEVVTFAGKKVLTLDPYSAELCGSRNLDCDGSAFFFSDSWQPNN